MPAKDFYHDIVKNSLIKDGWTITNDPLRLKWGIRELFVDLGVAKLIAATKLEQKIAVEIKSVISNCRLGRAIAKPNSTKFCWVSLPQPNLRNKL